MKKAIKEIIYWTLAVLFAGAMLVGAVAEFDVAPWAVGLVKAGVFVVGFMGCTWASNKTTFLRRFVGEDLF